LGIPSVHFQGGAFKWNKKKIQEIPSQNLYLDSVQFRFRLDFGTRPIYGRRFYLILKLNNDLIKINFLFLSVWKLGVYHWCICNRFIGDIYNIYRIIVIYSFWPSFVFLLTKSINNWCIVARKYYELFFLTAMIRNYMTLYCYYIFFIECYITMYNILKLILKLMKEKV
jgi:hypothetical protein